jgi:EAL domain-containing protein (putative c-di-GMP-specific phosphodiesterase class I)
MYDAKRSGRDRCRAYDPVMHAQAMARQELKADLESAVANGELTCLYQPFFRLADSRLTGFETLLRWHHPSRGPVSPLEFIQLAEETGRIRTIGRWVLRRACEQARRWDEVVPAGRAPDISVNVSAVQLADNAFPGVVADALQDSGLDPERLILEITESALLPGLREVGGRLREIRDLGVRLAIDDFGTGYSSLSYVQHLPLDVLKVDKAFVEQLRRADDDAAMTRVVIQIAQALRLTVIAEGVERPDQLSALRTLGCDYAQGFLLGRLMTADEAIALVAEQGATGA